MASKLFSPLRLRELAFKNQIFLSPMCQYSSENGMPTDWHFVHLGSRAVGGAALVMVEATAVSSEGRISPWDSGMWSDAHAQAFKGITGFVKKQGAVPVTPLAPSIPARQTGPPNHGQAGSWLSYDEELKSLDMGGFSPIPFKSLRHEPYARHKFHEFVRATSDGILLILRIPHLFHILFGRDPAYSTAPGQKIFQKIWKGLLEVKAHQIGIYSFHLFGLPLDGLGLGRFISPETEYHIFRSKGVPIVELHPFAQLKFNHLRIGADRPRFCKKRREVTLRHGFQQGVMKQIKGKVGTDQSRIGRRIQPIC